MHRAPPSLRRALGLTAGFLALYGLWLLLVESFSSSEMLAGVAVAAAGVAAGDVALDHDLGLRGSSGVLRLAARTAPRMVAESWLVLWASALAALRIRPLRSAFRTVTFDVGGDDPASCGRRALCTAVQSIAPNTVVLGFDEPDVMVVHQLVPSGDTARRRRPRR